jgi:hypothetical protein
MRVVVIGGAPFFADRVGPEARIEIVAGLDTRFALLDRHYGFGMAAYESGRRSR